MVYLCRRKGIKKELFPFCMTSNFFMFFLIFLLLGNIRVKVLIGDDCKTMYIKVREMGQKSEGRHIYNILYDRTLNEKE